MGRTKIELVSSGSIDMFDDVSSPLSFAIADIRTPEKRDSSYSKTIKIPATKNNNKLFTHIFDLNIKNSSYNPNRKADCILFIDDVPQIYGYLQLLNIEVDDKSDMIYECAIRGQVGNIFQTLADTELSDLDLSSYNHTYDRPTQKATWTNTYINGYCYPFIDYGFDNNFSSFDSSHFMPAFFLRTLIDKIFSYSGFTYESSFFDSARFKALLIPATSLEYTSAQIAAKLFEANRSGTQNIATTGFNSTPISGYPQLQFNIETNDPANAYDTATYKWTPPANGYYDLYADCNLNTSGTIFSSTSLPSYIAIRKRDTITNTYTLIDTTYCLLNNVSAMFNVDCGNVFFKTTDEVDICIFPFAFNYQSSSIQWQFNATNSKFYNKAISQLQSGDTVDMTLAVPKKVKCKDLLGDVIRLFNLYVDVDKNDSRRLLIETRDDFYSSGSIVDWTYKLDNSQALEITPMGDLDFKTFNYKWKTDTDYYNKIYSERYSLDYGNRTVTVDNDFIKNTNELTTIFSATPLIGVNGDDKVYPKIWEVDNGVVKNKPFNIRLLYNGGIVNTNNSWTYTDAVQGNSTETTYLYAGHLDSVTNPTFDLNFAPPSELFYNTTKYTNNNIFNVYHKKYIDEITSQDSKIVIGYFYLTPKDILELDFRNKFYFEKQYFRLNKIYDYNPIGEEVTKCEFIKINEGITFSGTTSTINGGVGSIVNDPIPLLDTKPRAPILINGNRNVVSGLTRNGIIIGDDNYIHGGNNITLLNSSGCVVYDGLQNVTVLNSSGSIISESNTLTIFNTTLTSGDIAGLGAEYKSVAFNASNYYGDFADLTPESTNHVNRYIKIGKTLYWNFYLQFYTTSGADSIIYLTIPNGYTSKNTLYTNEVALQLSTYRQTISLLQSASNLLAVSVYNSANFGTGTGYVVSFTITFEIE